MYIHLLFLHTFAAAMKIEEEIQSSFEDGMHKALVNILFTYNWITGKHSGILKPYGISVQQYNVLRILRGQHPKPASIKLISERMLDKNSNASRLVDKLLKKNYVERTSCEHDRRQVDILITKEGLQLLNETAKDSESMKKDLKLTEAECYQLSDLLDKMRG
jgi:DNA-binding MarR family transcriptional regulator